MALDRREEHLRRSACRRVDRNAANERTGGESTQRRTDDGRRAAGSHEGIVFRPRSAASVRNQNAGTVKTVEREIFLARAVIDRARMSVQTIAKHRIDCERAA